MLLITPQAFLTNTHADLRYLLRIFACAVTIDCMAVTHTHAAVWRSLRCQMQPEVCIYIKNHLHHVKPALLRKTNTDKRQTANYRKGNTFVNKRHYRGSKCQILPNTNESILKVCLVCVNIPGFFEFLQQSWSVLVPPSAEPALHLPFRPAQLFTHTFYICLSTWHTQILLNT